MDEPQKSIADLSTEERAALEAAHKQLHDAVRAYDRFLGVEAQSGRDLPLHATSDMSVEQVKVQDAETELWRLREQLLGWRRPAWAPSASSVSDWFSDEDSEYDNYPLPSSA